MVCIEDIFSEFKGRRAGVIKALTTDFRKFYQECHPDKDNLCLYGLPNGEWEVRVPDNNVPIVPDPVLGINFARDGMKEADWLHFVARRSDVWLLAVSFHYAIAGSINKAYRKKLYKKILNLPTVLEVVMASVMKRMEDEKKAASGSNNSNVNIVCGMCGESCYSTLNEFRYQCDFCKKWFHLIKCLKMTPTQAMVDKYKCPFCTNNPAA